MPHAIGVIPPRSRKRDFIRGHERSTDDARLQSATIVNMHALEPTNEFLRKDAERLAAATKVARAPAIIRFSKYFRRHAGE